MMNITVSRCNRLKPVCLITSIILCKCIELSGHQTCIADTKVRRLFKNDFYDVKCPKTYYIEK